MIKYCLPSVLLCACAPTAFAFPPCPIAPVELQPIGFATTANASPWYLSSYTLVGDPGIIAEVDASKLSGPDPHGGGDCKDRLPVQEGHASTGVMHLNPSFAPKSGFGLITLPEMPVVANDGMRIEYTLSFTVDNAPLANNNDWLDSLQLDFQRNGAIGMEYQQAVSAVYRLRKAQRSKTDMATIEVVESRTLLSLDNTSAIMDRVVAAIPLNGRKSGATPITLRWRQHAKGAYFSGTTAPGIHERRIDSVFSVIGPNGDVLYSTTLPAQWASTLSMGLLDYNVPDAAAYGSDFRVVVDDVWLAAKEF